MKEYDPSRHATSVMLILFCFFKVKTKISKISRVADQNLWGVPVLAVCLKGRGSMINFVVILHTDRG